MLFQLGPITFEVAPVNVDKFTQETGHDFAAKDIIGAMRPRESMGEADEKLALHGKLFPHHFGGGDQLNILQGLARGGDPQILVRGDGTNLGWFLIEKVKRQDEYLDAQGVGRVIEFDIDLVASPTRGSAGGIMSLLFSLFGGA